VGVAHKLYEGNNTYLEIFVYKLLTEGKFWNIWGIGKYIEQFTYQMELDT